MATSPTEFQVQSLYVGYLGRAAELSGRDFWVGKLQSGQVTIEQIAAGFATTPEYVAKYAGMTNAQFVAAVYRNVLGRPADPDGLNFWLGKVNSGEIPRDMLVLQMINGMSAIDQVRFDTRVQDGNEYTESAGAGYNLADAQEAVALLNYLRASVDGSPATSVDEGQTVNFLFNTIDFFPGSTLTYTITGVSAADVASGSLSGQVTLDALNQATISITLVADATTEGPETMTVSIGGLATAVTVDDTSTTPPPPAPTYAISSLQAGYVEGDTAVFNVVTTGLAAGTVLNYTISGAGITAGDFAGGQLTGTVVIGADGKGTITAGILADALTEGTETMTVTLDGTGASAGATISDTSLSPSYSVAADQASVTEGDSATFTITTANVAAGTVVSYTIGGGVDAADIAGPLTGTATIGSDGKATISVPTVSDGVAEGPETLSVTVSAPGGIIVGASTTLTDNGAFRLTSGQDGSAAQPAQAEVFDGSQEQSLNGPLNTLNDSDVLEGMGGSAVLNAVLGNTMDPLVTPRLINVNTVNLAFVSSLDQQFVSFQDATGTDVANITRVSGGLSAGILSMNGDVKALSAANTVLPVPNLIFDYQPGKAPMTVDLVLEDVTVADINLGEGAAAATKGGFFSSTIGTGISTVNLTSVGTNTVGTSTKNGLNSEITTLNLAIGPGMLTINGLTSATVETITGTGSGDLVLNEVGKSGSFLLDASPMTGNVTVKIDNAAPNGGAVFKTGSGNDTVTTATDLAGDIFTNDGNDYVSIGGNLNPGASISTGKGNDEIYTGNLQSGIGSFSSIDAGDGDDYVITGGVAGDSGGSAGESTIALGAGNDYLSVGGDVNGIVTGGAGGDTIEVFGNVPVGSVSGNGDSDSIYVYGTVGGNGVYSGSVNGNEGNDYLYVSSGVLVNGIVSGGDGDDTIIVASGGSKGTVSGGAGNDQMSISGGITGTSGQQVTGGTGMDYLVVNGAVVGGTAPAVDMGDDDDVYWQALGGAGTAITQGAIGVVAVEGGAPSASDTAVFDNTGAFALSVTNGVDAGVDGANALNGFETIQLLNRATGGAITADFGDIGGTPRVDLLSFDATTVTFNLTDLAGEPLFLTHDIEQGGNLPGIGAGSFDGFVPGPVVNTTNLNVAGGGGTLAVTIESPQSFVVNLDDTTGMYAGLTLAITNTTRDQTVNFKTTGGDDFGGSTVVTGSAAGRTITLNQIDSAKITADIAAHVNIVYGTNAGDTAIYDRDVFVKTGGGNDTLDLRNIFYDGGDGLVGGTIGDEVDLGGGINTMIIGNSTDIPPFFDRDEAFEGTKNVQNLWVDGMGTMVFLGDDANAAGIVNIKSMPGSNVNFETGGGFKANPLGVDLGLGSTLTLLNVNNNNLAITAKVNVAGAGADGDVTLNLANAGTGTVNLAVTIDADTPTWVYGGPVAGGNGKSEVAVTVGAGGIDNVTLIDSNIDTDGNGIYEPGEGDADNANVTVVTSNWNFGGAIKIDAGGIDNFDGVTATGAVLIDASSETGAVTLVGSKNDNTLIGSATAGNIIDGGPGNDVLIGGALADKLTGNGGNDAFWGGGGGDLLIGGSGDDYFNGGAGADTITTGTGDDVLDYMIPGDSVASNSASRTHDKVMDFDFASDTFSVAVPVVGIGGLLTITEGTGTLANYANLASFLVSRAEIQSLMLPAGVQALFVQILSPSFASGGINGATGDITLIIVDTNANNAYDPADLVVELDDDGSYSNPASWGLNNFGPLGNGTPMATPVIMGFVTDTNLPDNITSDNTLTVSGTANPFASVMLFDDADGDGFKDWNEKSFSTSADGAGNWGLTTSALADGTYDWVAQATLVDGNGSKFVSLPSAALTVTVDTTAPTVMLTPDDLMLADGEWTTITIQFSEEIDGTTFDITDLTLANANGVLSDFTMVDGDTYTVKFTPTDNIEDTEIVSVTAASYTDIAGNAGAGGDTDTIEIDTLEPGVTITVTPNDEVTADGKIAIGETAAVTIVFSEEVMGFSMAPTDITVEGGSLSALMTADNITWTATFTPNAVEDTTNVIAIIAGSYTDLFGNPGGGGTSNNYDIDTIAPDMAGIDLVSSLIPFNKSDTGVSDTDNITKDTTPTFDPSPPSVLSLDTNIVGGEVELVSSLDGIVATDGFISLGEATGILGADWITAGPMTDGVHNMWFVYYDSYGNPTKGAELEVRIDTVAPGTPAAPDLLASSDTGTLDDDNITNDTSPTFKIDLTGTSAEEGDLVHLFRGATKTQTQALTATDITNGYVEITEVPPPAAPGSGTFTYTSQIEDLAGNVGTKSAGLDVTFDTKAPTLTSVTYDAANNTLVFIGTGLLTVDQGAVDITDWVYDVNVNAFTYKFVSSDLVSITIVDDLTMRLEIVGSAASLIESQVDFGPVPNPDSLFVIGSSVVDLAGNAAPAVDTLFPI